jgi:hypothetical protein
VTAIKQTTKTSQRCVVDIDKHKAVSAEKGESESFPPRNKRENGTISVPTQKRFVRTEVTLDIADILLLAINRTAAFFIAQ